MDLQTLIDKRAALVSELAAADAELAKLAAQIQAVIAPAAPAKALAGRELSQSSAARWMRERSRKRAAAGLCVTCGAEAAIKRNGQRASRCAVHLAASTAAYHRKRRFAEAV